MILNRERGVLIRGDNYPILFADIKLRKSVTKFYLSISNSLFLQKKNMFESKVETPRFDHVTFHENSKYGRENYWASGWFSFFSVHFHILPTKLYKDKKNSNLRFLVTFPPMIWIFMTGEGDEIKSKQASKRDRTLPKFLNCHL